MNSHEAIINQTIEENAISLAIVAALSSRNADMYTTNLAGYTVS